MPINSHHTGSVITLFLLSVQYSTVITVTVSLLLCWIYKHSNYWQNYCSVKMKLLSNYCTVCTVWWLSSILSPFCIFIEFRLWAWYRDNKTWRYWLLWTSSSTQFRIKGDISRCVYRNNVTQIYQYLLRLFSDTPFVKPVIGLSPSLLQKVSII